MDISSDWFKNYPDGAAGLQKLEKQEAERAKLKPTTPPAMPAPAPGGAPNPGLTPPPPTFSVLRRHSAFLSREAVFFSEVFREQACERVDRRAQIC